MALTESLALRAFAPADFLVTVQLANYFLCGNVAHAIFAHNTILESSVTGLGCTVPAASFQPQNATKSESPALDLEIQMHSLPTRLSKVLAIRSFSSWTSGKGRVPSTVVS